MILDLKGDVKMKLKIVLITITLILLVNVTAVAVGLSWFDMAAENEYLELYINDRTTEMAVKEKASGTVWHSSALNSSSYETKSFLDFKYYD